jgi:NAD(P)-dependent dehydrogenase (short-subunit alcohol dehydrogenase family)
VNAVAQDSVESRGVALALIGRAVQLAPPLTMGFQRLGHRVVILTDEVEAVGALGATAVPVVDSNSRAQWESALREARAAMPALDLLVHGILPARRIESGPIGSLSLEGWQACCKVTMTATLRMLQATSTCFDSPHLAIVGLGPTFALTGAASHAPLCAALEGQRALFKSAARQWGTRGITLNWVCAAAESLSPVFDKVQSPRRPDPVAIALQRRPGLKNEICATLASFAGEASRHLTGTTINVDGGEWMVP